MKRQSEFKNFIIAVANGNVLVGKKGQDATIKLTPGNIESLAKFIAILMRLQSLPVLPDKMEDGPFIAKPEGDKLNINGLIVDWTELDNMVQALEAVAAMSRDMLVHGRSTRASAGGLALDKLNH